MFVSLQGGLTEEGRATLNFGATIPWAGDPRLSKKDERKKLVEY